MIKVILTIIFSFQLILSSNLFSKDETLTSNNSRVLLTKFIPSHILQDDFVDKINNIEAFEIEFDLKFYFIFTFLFLFLIYLATDRKSIYRKQFIPIKKIFSLPQFTHLPPPHNY